MKLSTLLNESGSKAAYVVSYSKAKTIEDFKKIVDKNPKNPPIEFRATPGGPVGTPDEFEDHFGVSQLIVIGPTNNYRIVLFKKNGKWQY
jgi:hypothetical protein